MNADLLRVFLSAMTPIGELRLSIPLGILGSDLPWLPVFLVSVAGNMAPVLPLLLGLERVSALLRRLPGPMGRLWEWRTERVRSAHADRIRRYGALALIFIVAVPLPLTGAWTGSLAAWLFQIPVRVALPAIAAGVVMAGIIVTAVVLAGLQIGLVLAG